MHDPPGVLVDQLDASVAHDVVHIVPQQDVRVQRAVNRGQSIHVGRRDQRPAAEPALQLGEALVGQAHVAPVLVGFVVHAVGQVVHQQRVVLPSAQLLAEHAGDHQRHPRLVDQDRIRLVDDGVVQLPMNLIPSPSRQGVAQQVEAASLAVA